MRLHGGFEGANDGVLVFRDDLPGRLEMVEAGFGQRLKLMADAYIEAAGIDAPAADPPPDDPWLPKESGARLNLDAENVTSVIWATRYGLDFRATFRDANTLAATRFGIYSRFMSTTCLDNDA